MGSRSAHVGADPAEQGLKLAELEDDVIVYLKHVGADPAEQGLKPHRRERVGQLSHGTWGLIQQNKD